MPRFGENDPDAVMTYVIQSACLNDTLMAIRDIDDFLLPRSHPDRKNRRARDTDLLASDFGYCSNKSFLDETLRNSINQLIAHTTTHGPRVYEKEWDIWKLTTQCLQGCWAFLEWLEQEAMETDFHLYTAALTCRTFSTKIYNEIGRVFNC